jgi:hypothetical protein
MSTGTIKTQTDNQLHVEYNISKIFVFNNRYEQETLLNGSGGIKTFLPGTLLGRVSASLKLVPVASAAVDGSEIPVGILASEVTDLAIAGEKSVQVCIFGDVVESKLILDGSDTVDTLIDGRPIKDRIAADTKGIQLVDGFEMTKSDNS